MSILKDVSVAAIVRDELKNPAGGIKDFVASFAPHVEEMVVVDTGSLDGTRGALEDLQSQYGNLRVFDRKFDGFHTSRNFSLDRCRTKYALVVDADERIRAQDFRHIQIEEDTYAFRVRNVVDRESTFYGSLNPRIIPTSARFKGEVFEHVFLRNKEIEWRPTWNAVELYHFRSSHDAHDLKVNEFYSKLFGFTNYGWNNRFGTLCRTMCCLVDLVQGRIPGKSPSPYLLPSYDVLRVYNPKREEYR
jgi:glycosyltransferase involved in cell wall biosynthesis